MIPCASAAFRRMPAFFIAAVRSGPCGIARASSSAACASASKSSSGRLFLAMVKKLRHRTAPCLSDPRHCGFGRLPPSPGLSWFQVRNRKVSSCARSSGKEFVLQISHRVGDRTDTGECQGLSCCSHSTVGLAMQRPSDTQISPFRRQAADALRRARKLPVGHARNNLRQLASGLLWLDKRNLRATVQDRVTAILALTDLRS